MGKTYLKIQDITGTSKDRGRAAWMDVLNYSLDTRSPHMGPGVGSGPGRQTSTELHVDRRRDRASTELALSLSMGTIHGEAVLEVVGKKGRLFTVAMKRVVVVGIVDRGRTARIELAFQEVRFSGPGPGATHDFGMPGWKLSAASAGGP